MKKIHFLLFILFASIVDNGFAQLNPSPSQFYFNKLQQNVAASGFDKGLRVDASYRNFAPNGFVGSPVNIYFGAQSSVGERSGVGLQFQSENAGLLSRSRMLGSYAIDFGNEDLHTRIGIGMGFMFARINQSSPLFRGDVNDPFIAQFNAKQLKLDGSIGIQIESANGWSFMASSPSVGSIQQFSDYEAIDYVLLTSTVSKKITLSGEEDDQIAFTPLLGYQLMQGVDGVFQGGVLLDYRNWIKFMGMYYSNSEYSAGVSIPVKNKLALNFMYNSGKIYGKGLLNVGGTMEAHIMYRFGGN